MFLNDEIKVPCVIYNVSLVTMRIAFFWSKNKELILVKLQLPPYNIYLTCLLVVVVGFGVVESDIELVVASREVVDAENEFKSNEDV